MATPEEDRIAAIVAELRGCPDIHLKIDAESLLNIIRTLQVELRHPRIPPSVFAHIDNFVRKCHDNFRRNGYPAIVDAIDRGFNPSHDYRPGGE